MLSFVLLDPSTVATVQPMSQARLTYIGEGDVCIRSQVCYSTKSMHDPTYHSQALTPFVAWESTWVAARSNKSLPCSFTTLYAWTYLFTTKKGETKILGHVHDAFTFACIFYAVVQSHGINSCTCKFCNEDVPHRQGPFPTNYTWQIYVGTFYHRGALLLPKTKRTNESHLFRFSLPMKLSFTSDSELCELFALLKASFVAPRISHAVLENRGLQSSLGLLRHEDTRRIKG